MLENTRPDRQTVLFSATFPKQMEALAKKHLRNPIEMVVGGRSVVSNTIEHFVELRAPETRFLRTLELLGEWYDKGSVLVFVERQARPPALHGSTGPPPRCPAATLCAMRPPGCALGRARRASLRRAGGQLPVGRGSETMVAAGQGAPRPRAAQ
jgi:hypothetical protein